MTITFNALSPSIPALKQAAKELNIDLISSKPNGEYTEVHVIIVDYYQLVLLGTIAGINSSYNNMKNPLAQIADTISRKIENYKRNKTDDDNKL